MLSLPISSPQETEFLERNLTPTHLFTQSSWIHAAPPLHEEESALFLNQLHWNITPSNSLATNDTFNLEEAEYINLINTGSSDNRIDIWYVGDGYTLEERQSFLDDVMNQFEDLISESALNDPFGRYQNFFNVHVVFVPSVESGADRPEDNVFVDTAFDGSFSFGGGPERLLYFSNFKADTAIASVIPDNVDIDMLFGIINTNIYGGGGGKYAVFAGKNSSAFELALHELGHSYVNLADEYWTDGESHSGGEPSEVNVTTNSSGQKWAHWLGFDDGVLGPIGAYEGGLYVETGIYRPTDGSKMRFLNEPFDAIAKEQFILEFYSQVHPIDSAFGQQFDGSIINPTELFATLIDPAIFTLEWTLDGQTVGSDELLDISSLNLDPGQYELIFSAQDMTSKVRINLEMLYEEVSWSIIISDQNLTGTDLNDLIFGTDNDDEIQGGAGDDVIVTGDGNNVAHGGDGDDLLVGGDISAAELDALING